MSAPVSAIVRASSITAITAVLSLLPTRAINITVLIILFVGSMLVAGSTELFKGKR